MKRDNSADEESGHVVVSIQARMSSSRLPGKVLLPIGGVRILARTIRQCRQATTPDGIAITTGDRLPDQAITGWCSRRGVTCVSADEQDLVERHLRVAEEFDTDSIVRVCSDSPFLPPNEIDRLVRVHDENDAAITTNNTGRMPDGTIVDVIDTALLEELAADDEIHPVRPVLENPDRWRVVRSHDASWEPYADTDIAVDEPDDYWRAVDAVEAVGDDPMDVAAFVTERR